MQLTERHIQVIREFLNTNQQGASYEKYFGTGKKDSDKVSASNFFKKPEVKKMLKTLQEVRDKAIIKATQDTYEKLYAEGIATELELDILHTRIIRGEEEMEEIFAVREKTFNMQKSVYEDVTMFKRVKRKATIKEKQISISELYKRKGSYKGVARINPDQDDQVAAERAKNAGVNDKPVERMVVLSNGEKIPFI